jgi:hypothetical protein
MLQGNAELMKMIRNQWIAQQINSFKNKEPPGAQVEELRKMMLADP